MESGSTRNISLAVDEITKGAYFPFNDSGSATVSKGEALKERLIRYSFFNSTASYWLDHVIKVLSSEINQMIISLLENRLKVSIYWEAAEASNE